MEKFISIKGWLLEKKEEKKKEKEEKTYGCVMLDTKMSNWKADHTDGIDKKDLYETEDDYGINEDPHVTLLYGIHEDDIDPEIIMSVIENELEPVIVTISEISCFENDEYDVVKYDVPVTKQLKKYRKIFEKNFKNTQTFPDYHPHITLAYVKSGEGKKYTKTLDEPFEVTFNKGVYSFHEKNKDGEIEMLRKEFVFPTEDDVPEVNLDN